MDEILNLSSNKELLQDSSSESTSCKLRESINEVFAPADLGKCAKIAAIAAAAAAGAIAVCRFGLPRLFGKAEEKIVSTNLRSAGKQVLDEPLANAATASETIHLLEPLPTDFRYFQHCRTGIPDVYRWPANGLPLNKQSIESVERYAGNGRWSSHQRERLLDETYKGWFEEVQDEVSPEKALELIKKQYGLPKH